MIQFTVLEATDTIVHIKSINQTFYCTIKLFGPSLKFMPKNLGGAIVTLDGLCLYVVIKYRLCM